MKGKQRRGFLACLLAVVLLLSAVSPVQAAENTPSDMVDFDAWKTGEWDGKAQYDSAGIVLTPGTTASKMNFCWYSETQETPKVKIAKDKAMTDAQTFTGTAQKIDRTNGQKNYTASNKVTVTGLQERTKYYYSYSTDDTTWSDPQHFNTQQTSALELILVGDPQIGASSGDNDIVYDTYQWNKTLQTAFSKYPDANFILSAGDQIDYSTDGTDNGVRRELEYAGFLYPQALRNYPLATAIGNHESKSADYTYHYNNPNAQANLGDTASGGDYYFNYGKALFIVLNSNNRNAAEHDELLAKAVNDPESKNAKWKIVMFHHDIYGSGAPHSDIDGANLRALFAPLMDKYNIDVCLTGHDHSYSRTYQIIDGKAVSYQSDSAKDPQGTVYIATNSASGSKYYELNPEKQYFINKRHQEFNPNYSVVNITDSGFSIETLNAFNNISIDKYSITKTQTKQSLASLINTAKEIVQGSAYATAYTEKSRKSLEDALDKANDLLETAKDGIPEGLYGNYDKTIQEDNKNDKLNYYAYAATQNGAIEKGYAAFLDKTLDNSQAILGSAEVTEAYAALDAAVSGLTKVPDDDKTPDPNDNDTPNDDNTAPKDNNNNSDNGGTPKKSKGGAPQTGDNTDAAVAILGILLLTSTAVAVGLRVKKHFKSA